MLSKSVQREGIKYATLAYLSWGLFPIYWKLLKHISPLEILFHRVFWSALFYYGLLCFKKGSLFVPKFPGKQSFYLLIAASVLIGLNWGLYIYTVNSGRIVESSLGYFINPIFNIFAGIVLLKEKLQRYQKIAATLAFLGVCLVTIDGGQLPFLALALAATFCGYGILKKFIVMPSLESGFWESILLILPLSLMVFGANSLNIISYSKTDWLLLIFAGVVTGTPLLWFTEAARRLPYSTLAFFQYISPTLQFLTGILLFNELLSPLKTIGFSFIWAGLSWVIAHQARSLKVRKADQNN